MAEKYKKGAPALLDRSIEWCYANFTGNGTLNKIFVGLAVLWFEPNMYENITDPSELRKFVINNCSSGKMKNALVKLRHARNCTEHKGLNNRVITEALDAARF